MLNGLEKKAGAKNNIHPHTFRYGRLTDLAMRGFNEMELQIFAGWTKGSMVLDHKLALDAQDLKTETINSLIAL